MRISLIRCIVSRLPVAIACLPAVVGQLGLATPGYGAPACVLPAPEVGPLYATKVAGSSDVRLVWAPAAVDSYDAWRTEDELAIPALDAWGLAPAVLPVAGCTAISGSECVDAAAWPVASPGILFYQMRGLCCGAESLDPEIVLAAASIDTDRIAGSIATLSGFVTRLSCSDGSGATSAIGAARDWVRARFEEIPGVEVALDEYDQTGCSRSVRQSNVVAWLPGALHPERLVVVGGHYDSRGLSGTDPTAPAPGANDSGSQTALVIEVARVLAAYRFDATLVFIAFAGEEQGLVGSAHFAAEFASIFPGASVEAMLNCDIVGGDKDVNDAVALGGFRLFSPGTPREISASAMGAADDTSPSRGLMRHVGHWGAAYAPSMSMLPQLREDRPGRGGDHKSFIAQALPAVRFIEVNENLPHQHSPDDLLEFVTPAYTARVASVVAATAANLGRAPRPPRDLSASLSLPDRLDISWSPSEPGVAAAHYAIAVRAITDNLYSARFCVRGDRLAATPRLLDDLGLAPGVPFYVSVAAIDAQGHESLFAYPELRCAGSRCEVPAGSLDVTATR